MPDQPIDCVANQARQEWRVTHSKSMVERLFRLLGAMSPAEVIYVAEYSTGDWDKARCTGDPVRVWAYRGDEFEQVDAIGELDMSGIASRTPVIRYCLDQAGERMIHTTWNGCRAGYGHILKRVGDRWKSTGGGWRS